MTFGRDEKIVSSKTIYFVERRRKELTLTHSSVIISSVGLWWLSLTFKALLSNSNKTRIIDDSSNSIISGTKETWKPLK